MQILQNCESFCSSKLSNLQCKENTQKIQGYLWLQSPFRASMVSESSNTEDILNALINADFETSLFQSNQQLAEHFQSFIPNVSYDNAHRKMQEVMWCSNTKRLSSKRFSYSFFNPLLSTETLELQR